MTGKHAVSIHGYRFLAIATGAAYFRCLFCRAVVHADDCASHVLETHPVRALPGQLALPETGVAEVTL